MGFTATITTYIAPAWDLVTRPLPLDYLCTRLTQPDPLMHFFSIIRLRGGLNNNLNSSEIYTEKTSLYKNWCRDSLSCHG